MTRLMIVGGVALDYLSKVQNIDAQCSNVEEYSENIGGMAYNTAVASAQLGIDTRLVASVGKDFPLLPKEKNLNFDFHINEGLTTRSFLFFGDGKEKIFFFPGEYHKIDTEKAAHTIKKSDWIHFAGVMPCFQELIRIADEENKIVSTNPGYDLYHYDPNDKVVRELLKKSDYSIISSEEARHLNKPVDSLVNGAVIVTMGKNGSVVVEKNSRTPISAYPVKSKSPFGAGDAYSGAFIAAMIHGNDPIQSAKLASAASSFAVEEQSTTPKLMWEKIEKRAKKI